MLSEITTTECAKRTQKSYHSLDAKTKKKYDYEVTNIAYLQLLSNEKTMPRIGVVAELNVM